MLRFAVVLAMAASVAGCAVARPVPEPLPVCDGRHRRPANPYGSVLSTAASPSPGSAPTPNAVSTLPSLGACA